MPAPQITASRDPAADFFTLSSDYSAPLVSRLRSIPGARWVAKRKVWRIPATLVAVEALAPVAALFGFIFDDAAHDLVMNVNSDAHFRSQLSSARDRSVSPAFQQDVVDRLPYGRDLYEFQPAAVAYGVLAQRIILGDKMGLGKTIEALAILEVEQAYPALIVCKKTALGHWQRAIARWSTRPDEIELITWGKLSARPLRDPDAKRARPAYEGIVLDESHLAKSRHAKRTKNAKDLAHGVRIRLLLSGTPVINRPSDLIAQLDILGQLDALGGFWYFAKRFCAGFEGKYGWDFTGASNLDELQRLLRASCFVSREKKGPLGVLDSLPDKSREMVEVVPTLPELSTYLSAEKDLLSWLAVNVSPEAAERATQAEALVRLTTLKHLAARLKVATVIDWIRDFCEDNPEEKLVVFAHHRDVIDAILAGIQIKIDDRDAIRASCLVGSMDDAERESQLAFFKRPDGARVLVASLKTGGESIDLTEASTVAFVEFDWTPAAHEQAEDRCHRIGQKNAVIAYWFAVAGTIEDDICELLNKKQETVGLATSEITGPLIARLTQRTPKEDR